MAKGKTKKGKVGRPKKKSAKSSGKKSPKAKSPKIKKDKVEEVIATPEELSAEETTEQPAAEEPSSDSGDDEIEAIVVEVPKETTLPPAPRRIVPPAPQFPEHITALANSFKKTINNHRNDLTKKQVEELLNRHPQSVYAVARYSADGKSYTIELTDGKHKLTIPSNGAYPLG